MNWQSVCYWLQEKNKTKQNCPGKKPSPGLPGLLRRPHQEIQQSVVLGCGHWLWTTAPGKQTKVLSTGRDVLLRRWTCWYWESGHDQPYLASFARCHAVVISRCLVTTHATRNKGLLGTVGVCCCYVGCWNGGWERREHTAHYLSVTHQDLSMKLLHLKCKTVTGDCHAESWKLQIKSSRTVLKYIYYVTTTFISPQKEPSQASDDTNEHTQTEYNQWAHASRKQYSPSKPSKSVMILEVGLAHESKAVGEKNRWTIKNGDPAR